jgi:membrane-associated phospholipid phosphatase
MLVDLMAYRDGVMSEAMTQATGIIPYFQGLAGFTAASHKETTDLCIIALNLGQFMVMYYKKQYDRPRPSQLRPALLPSMEVPGHASYPSGHSTESHLIAGFLELVLNAGNPALPLLHPLADRIAINREVMGLHYRSDSEAGQRLASTVTRLICRLADEPVSKDKHPILYETLKAAWLEWHPKQDFEKAWGPDMWPQGTATWPVTAASNSAL